MDRRSLTVVSHLAPVLLLTLGAAEPAPAQSYLLGPESTYAAGCTPPCLCPVQLFSDVEGAFELDFAGTTGSFDIYDVSNFDVVVTAGSNAIGISGSGTYRVDATQDPQLHEMILELDVDGETHIFESGIVESDTGFPQISLVIAFSNGCFIQSIGIVAEPFTLEAEFLRGDVNGDGAFNGLIDGLFALNFQFVAGSPEPGCLDAADVDGDGAFNGLVDGLYALNAQFLPGSPPPPPPFPDCAVAAVVVGCGVSCP